MAQTFHEIISFSFVYDVSTLHLASYELLAIDVFDEEIGWQDGKANVTKQFGEVGRTMLGIVFYLESRQKLGKKDKTMCYIYSKQMHIK